MLITMLFAQHALACVPCREYWELEKTAKEAQLVIIGTRITPAMPGETLQQSGPQFMDIVVEDTLKGNLQTNKIKTDGWYGMCPYGIVTPPDKPFIMFLTKQAGKDFYQPLNDGCAVSSLAIKDEQIITPEGSMTMETLRKLLQ